MVIHNRISVQYVSQEREDMNNKCVCVCVCVSVRFANLLINFTDLLTFFLYFSLTWKMLLMVKFSTLVQIVSPSISQNTANR